MLLFHDSFDNYSAYADMLMNWDSFDNDDAFWTFNSTGGVLGGGCMFCIVDDYFARKRFRSLIGSSETKIRFAAWFKSSSAEADVVGQLRDENLGYAHYFWISTGGFFGVSISNTSSSASTYYGVTNVCDNNWHFIEVYINAHATAGDIKVIIDGVVEVNQTGIDTAAGSNVVDRFTALRLGTPNSDGCWDDVMVWDDNAGDNFTGELGGLRYIRPLRPIGAGSAANFTATGAATNHEAVDETGGHDGNTTYVTGSVSGDKDLYAFENLPGGVTTVEAVIVTAITQTAAGSTTQLKLKCKSGTTEGDGPAEDIVSDVWTMKRACFGQNPDTSAVWTTSEVDGAEFGIEVV